MRKKFTIPLILVLISSFFLMLNSSLKESATMDELAHIPAGYTYLKFGDNRLNPEHPPLLKNIAALPLLFLKLNFPLDSEYWQNYTNGQWDVGREFLYKSGNDANKIINWARLGPMILTVLTSLLLFFVSKERLGSFWAFLPLFLFSFSPLVLAHGHYVTTDLAATFGSLLSLWLFIKYLKNQNRKNLLLAGLAFGVGQLLKFSLVLLIPIFLILAIIFFIVKTYQKWPEMSNYRQWRKTIIAFFKILGSTIIIFLIGYLIVYLVYLPQNLNYPAEKQKFDTNQILTSFGGGPDPEWRTCKSWTGSINRQMRCLANINIWMSDKPIFKPLSQYLLGLLMVIQRSSVGNTGYFLGEVSATGWHTYFPVVFLIKEPLPSLILIVIALIIAFWRVGKSLREKKFLPRMLTWIWQHFSEFSMLIFVIIYWLSSIGSPLNIGLRHLLPTLPFTYLLVATGTKKWWRGEDRHFFFNWWEKLKFYFKKFSKMFLKSGLLTILFLWYLLETLFIAPHFIAYFNEIIGGSKNGYLYVVDSNLDWGQDLKRLSQFVEKNKIEKIKVDYFGGGSPEYYLKEKFEPWWSSRGQPEAGSWFAISLTFLQNSQGKAAPGFERKFEDTYWWLENKKPFSRIGYSIFVYKF